MKKPMVNMMMKEKFDDLYTPKRALDPLYKYLPKDTSKVIWECCDSDKSNITLYFKEKGYDVISTDIKTGFDFLEEPSCFDWDILVTNPPYSLKTKFLRRCFEYSKPFALLLPLTALEGKERGELFDKYGISAIIMDSRLDFTGKGANWFGTAWFCWNLPVLGNNRIVFEKI